MIAKTLYYPVWVSQTGRVSLRWGPPCDAPGEALRVGRARIAAGDATIVFVVKFSAGKKTPMPTFIYPPSARQIIRHWESLWDATEPPDATPAR